MYPINRPSMRVCEARERRQTTFARLGLKRGDSFLPCCTGHVSGHWGRPEASGICRARTQRIGCPVLPDLSPCLSACGQRAPLPSVTAFGFSHTRDDPVTGVPLVLACWGLRLYYSGGHWPWPRDAEDSACLGIRRGGCGLLYACGRGGWLVLVLVVKKEKARLD